MTIKAFIFDYGNVVIKPTRHQVNNAVADFLKLPRDSYAEFRSKIHNHYQTGKMSDEEFLEKLNERFQIEADESVFKVWEEVLDQTEYYEHTIEIIEQLKEEGYIVGCLSNTVPPFRDYNLRYGYYTFFNPLCITTDMGCRKPDKEAYEYLLSKLPDLKPEEIVFIDDKEANLAPAKKLGINTIHFTDDNLLADQIREFINFSY